MENEETQVEGICKDMLEMLGNSTTKTITAEDYKNSYYVFLNDTIYLSARQTSEERKDSRIILIAHECIHSVQSKILQGINFVLSNIEMIMFGVLVILYFIVKNLTVYSYIYATITLLTIAIRFVLEMGAVLGSLKLSKKYLKNKGMESKEIVEKIDKQKKLMIMTFPIFLLSLFGWKLIRMLLAVVIL